MSDEIKVEEPDHFSRQANLHRDTATHAREMATRYQSHHDALIAAWGSQDSQYIQSYQSWWEQFKTYMMQHADLHEAMADHLQTASANYAQTEQDNTQSMTTQGEPS